ncbi:hypothetical protein CEXT_372521 [Caerostris extrusa]|uniref:Uncharacterized protein n=1 Tax=Caerostris extrusa TaxID=172846 RepID=A0AAV4VL91_CAEEX|nr:hypothetical protein CEXT_372521 [Caerostris extrusa]
MFCIQETFKKSLDADTALITNDRIRDAAVFEVVGEDLVGSLYLKDQKKTWVCLFTYVVYQAEHIELVSNKYLIQAQYDQPIYICTA